MNLEQQVVSLEYAKRLKEFGVTEKARFMWVEEVDGHGIYLHPTHDNQIDENSCGVSEARYPTLYKNYFAYSVAELGELLPEKVCWRGYANYGGEWKIQFGDFEAKARTEADCKAIMLIYLLENGLATL